MLIQLTHSETAGTPAESADGHEGLGADDFEQDGDRALEGNIGGEAMKW